MTSIAEKDNVRPWYREPWPWLLMSGPVIVIIAALASAWIAIRSSDGLVSDDYYKQGLAAGQTIAKNQRAEELGIQAGLRLTEKGMQVRLSGQLQAAPPALLVTLSHPTRAGLDQQVRLARDGDSYAGAMHLPASGHWLVLVEDEARTWRVMGSVLLPAANETVIGGGETTGKPQR